MEEFISRNPYTGKLLATYKADEEAERETIIAAAESYRWRARNQSPSERVAHILAWGQKLALQREAAAQLMAQEMGKPLAEGRAEIDKCLWLCQYYAEEGPGFLAPEPISTDADYSERQYEPMGVLLAIMPWNFPFWQVFRMVVPAYLAGNAVLLKHAPNVQGAAEMMVALWRETGAQTGSFQNLRCPVKAIPSLLTDRRIKAVSLTGSTAAGRKVAAEAGRHLKKCVLELGGSNAFLLLEDADLDKAVDLAVKARGQNAGQSCIAAKRFIVPRSLESAFSAALAAAFAEIRVGDPCAENTDMGPLARQDLRENLHQQVEEALQAGAELLCGGTYEGNCYRPTVLRKLTSAMRVFKEETFGPVAAVIAYDSWDEAVALVNGSDYGLGLSIITRNAQKAQSLSHLFEEGSVFINDLVKSDPRLPFGGVKDSGYGRELSREGMRAFCHVKSIYRRDQLA